MVARSVARIQQGLDAGTYDEGYIRFVMVNARQRMAAGHVTKEGGRVQSHYGPATVAQVPKVKAAARPKARVTPPATRTTVEVTPVPRCWPRGGEMESVCQPM